MSEIYEAYTKAMVEIVKKDAEIERLKDALRQNAEAQATFQTIVREQRELITELADALPGPPLPIDKLDDLLQKAREPVK